MKSLLFAFIMILLVVSALNALIQDGMAQEAKSLSLLCRSFAKAATELDEHSVNNLAEQIGYSIQKIAKEHGENPEAAAKAFCGRLATESQEVLSTLSNRAQANAILELLVKGYNVIINTARKEKI